MSGICREDMLYLRKKWNIEDMSEHHPIRFSFTVGLRNNITHSDSIVTQTHRNRFVMMVPNGDQWTICYGDFMLYNIYKYTENVLHDTMLRDSLKSIETDIYNWLYRINQS